ncbi:MAG: hypothetical protein ACE14S_05260 [Candidatus Bathyarchaeia archaeon]
MTPERLFTSSRVFLILGVALLVLAAVSFPTRIVVGDMAEPMGYDKVNVGWLFAPVVGVWGLASLVMGLAQSSAPRSRVEPFLLLILALVSAGAAYAGYLAFAFGTPLLHLAAEPFFWLYFTLCLVPAIVVYVFGFRYFRAKERGELLARKKTKVMAFAATLTVPVSYFAAMLFYLNLVL